MKKKDNTAKNTQKSKTPDKKSGKATDVKNRKIKSVATVSKTPLVKTAKPAPPKAKTAAPKPTVEKKKTAAPKDIKKTAPAEKAAKKTPPKKTVAKTTTPEKKVRRPAGKEVKGAGTLKKRPPATQIVQHKLKPFETAPDKGRIMSMTVSPGKLYAYWEITKEKLSGHKGSLNLKITNLKTGEFFYLPISETVDEHFINVSPNGRYTVQAGIIDQRGQFIVLERSPEVSTPPSSHRPQSLTARSGTLRRKAAIMAKAGKLVIFEINGEGLPEEFFTMTGPTGSY